MSSTLVLAPEHLRIVRELMAADPVITIGCNDANMTGNQGFGPKRELCLNEKNFPKSDVIDLATHASLSGSSQPPTSPPPPASSSARSSRSGRARVGTNPSGFSKRRRRVRTRCRTPRSRWRRPEWTGLFRPGTRRHRYAGIDVSACLLSGETIFVH